jgi:hypothetical protein
MSNAYKILHRKSSGMKQLARPRRRREDNVNGVLKERGLVVGSNNRLTILQRALVNMEMNLGVP